MIVGVDEAGEVIFELFVTIVMIAFDCRFLDRAVHPFDLAIGPRTLDFGAPVLDAVLPAAHVELMRHVSRRRALRVTWKKGELDAIAPAERRRDSRNQGLEERRRRRPPGLFHQLHEGEFAGAADGGIEVELALGGLDFWRYRTFSLQAWRLRFPAIG